MDEQLRKLIEGAKAQGATNEDIKRIIDMYVADSKKKRVSEPIAAQKPLASSTPTQKPATSLATEEPEQVQASDGLGGPAKNPFGQEQKPVELGGFSVNQQPVKAKPSKLAPKGVFGTEQKPVELGGFELNKPPEKYNTEISKEDYQKQINKDALAYNKTLYDNFLNAHKDSDIDRQEAAQETDDEFKKQGVLNTLKDFGKNAWNTIVDVNATGLSFGTTDKGPEFLKFETDPTKEYTDKANKEYEEKLRLTEEARKIDPSIQIPSYDPEQIKKRAYEIAVQSKLDGKRQSRINDFMRDHKKEYDLGTLKKYTERDYQTISNEDKKLLEANKLANSVYQISNNNLIGIANKIKDLDSKNQEVPQELINQLKTERENNDYLRDAYLKANEDYTKKHEKLGDFTENLDILNRDYSFGATTLATLGKIGGETVRGVLGGMDYVSQFFPKTKEFEITNNWIREKSKNTAKRIEEIEGSVEKPIEAKNISSASDFGRWLTNGVILPTAGFMSKASLGTPGIGMLVNESVGNTYEGMIDQMDADPNIKYSQAQLIGVPAAKGAIDAALFAFDASLLKGAQRVIKSATAAEKDLIAESVLKQITNKQLHGAAVMNGITIAKNAVDKFSGVDPNKNLLEGTGEATAVSIATVGMLDTAPRIGVHVASEFSLDNSALKASAKVNDLTLRLDQKGLSDEHKEIISKQLEKAKEDMHKIVKSQVRDISSLSDSQYKETIRLNNTRANIFEKAKSIKMDQSIKPELKKQLFEGLKEELDATNNRRRELLLNGPKAELERMDPVVADALRSKAEAQLIKENNPNGDKDVTIPQADIDKRAMVLHNEKAFEAKQAKENPAVNEEFESKKLEIEKNREKAHKDLEKHPQAVSINGNYSIPKQIEISGKSNELRSTKDIDAEYDKQQEALKKEYEAPAVNEDIESQKADIEKRRQEDLEPINLAIAKGNQTGEIPVVDGEMVNKKTIKDINAKYDSELAALEEKPSGEKVVPLHEALEGVKDIKYKKNKIEFVNKNIDKIIKELGLETKNCD